MSRVARVPSAAVYKPGPVLFLATLAAFAGSFVLPDLVAAREPAMPPATAKISLRMVAGTWAPSAEQCADPDMRLNQRIAIDATEGYIVDGRMGDTHCVIKKQLRVENAVAMGLRCTYSQEGAFDFETAVVARRTGDRTLLYTNIQVDKSEQTIPLVRCDKQTGFPPAKPVDAPAQKNTAAAADPSPQYVLPPLKEGEFYAGNAYVADYAEQRETLTGEGAKPLTTKDRVANCPQAFCKKYPEVRACGTSTPDNTPYCVARWQTKEAATVDYVVQPNTLEVLKKVCRDTCGVDAIAVPYR